jgi:3-phenylpropionate/cinnamic acid dioxygenase small subunit
MTCSCADRQAIVDLLNRYSTCLDARDWQGLEQVFDLDAVGVYGGRTHEGRDEIVRAIAGFLDLCGASQHLLGNYEIHLDGDEATSATRARVIHVGAGDNASLTPYESIGTYRDRLARTAEGWRLVRREFDVQIETGDRRVFRPAQTRS